ncbi:membrane-associated oxidoreductase [Actinomadura craniellae]|uniref:Membrane-associated oxidoreductase n=1 Tax=Actinomadura craniellae TaxID=2231787 RepID=A0A365H3F5_9ACTN|nr:membrane-associated oxidoreductase [Actinomadura craniellae]RAY12743.1 membrane-associated oxidoreductase [Actinomadura craniellae]
MEIAEMSPAERRVWRAFPRGGTVDFRRSDDEDAEDGHAWAPERTVRAEFLRALLLSGSAEEGEVAALRVAGARITGVLDLQYATVEHAIRLWGCHFERPAILYGARVRQLNLSHSYLPALEAATLHVDGVLRLTDCVIPGQVRLGGARLSGALFMERARLGDEDGDEDDVLHLNHAIVDDDLWAPGLTVHGEIRLNGTKVSGTVNLDEAVLLNPGGTVLDAKSFVVGTDLQAVGMRAEGRVNLRGTTVAGGIYLAEARLSNPGGTALRATSVIARELWLRNTPRIEGTVNLRRSQFETLHATPDVWPDVVGFDGLTYGALTPHLPAEQRLPLLEREEGGYVPYAYEQLAAAYLRIGDDTAARTVQLAKQRRHRSTLPWYAKAWGHLQDATVGYGFRPVRAASWLVTLLVIGTVIYGLEQPPALKPGEAPTFNPLFYTFDLLLPIIDFGQEKAFKPQGWYQWLSYTLILAGWILATTIATGITRTVSRQ